MNDGLPLHQPDEGAIQTDENAITASVGDFGSGNRSEPGEQAPIGRGLPMVGDFSRGTDASPHRAGQPLVRNQSYHGVLGSLELFYFHSQEDFFHHNHAMEGFSSESQINSRAFDLSVIAVDVAVSGVRDVGFSVLVDGMPNLVRVLESLELHHSATFVAGEFAVVGLERVLPAPRGDVIVDTAIVVLTGDQGAATIPVETEGVFFLDKFDRWRSSGS